MLVAHNSVARTPLTSGCCLVRWCAGSGGRQPGFTS